MFGSGASDESPGVRLIEILALGTGTTTRLDHLGSIVPGKCQYKTAGASMQLSCTVYSNSAHSLLILLMDSSHI